MNFQLIRNIESNFDHLEESEINKNGGWMVSAVTEQREALGSGCHINRETARRIAVAEMLERAIVRRVSDPKLRAELLLDEYPTTCGFAAGFENRSTKARSIAEGLERWIWSKWIDERFYIEKILPTQSEGFTYSTLFRTLSTYFDSFEVYQRTFDLEMPSGRLVKFRFGSILARSSSGGLYPGSRVCSIGEDPLEHAIIEAWRHLQLARLMKEEADAVLLNRPIFQKRVLYFSENGACGLEQVARAHKRVWPQPKVRIHMKVPGIESNLYLWRTLMHDFVGWDRGELDRFVY